MKNRVELEIPPGYFKTVSSFLVTSCDLYATERERREALLPILNELLGQPITPGTLNDGNSSDGICTAKVQLGESKVNALLMLWQLKNEIGTGMCDRSIQAAFSFTRWWPENDVSSLPYPYHTGADAGLAPTCMAYQTGPLC